MASVSGAPSIYNHTVCSEGKCVTAGAFSSSHQITIEIFGNIPGSRMAVATDPMLIYESDTAPVFVSRKAS